MAKGDSSIPTPIQGPAVPVTVAKDYNIPPPLIDVPNVPPIKNTPLPNPKILQRTAERAPRQLTLTAGKAGQPEPYIFGRCIVDPVLIAADDTSEFLVMDVLWSVGEIDHFEGLYVDRVFEGRADQLGNIEHFHGESGQSTSTIMAALKGSYDQLDEKAHSVMRWQVGWSLQIQGWARGLLLWDPRESPQAYVYSTNPALALARVLVDSGYTMNWASVADAADYCDELIGSPNVKRWEIGGQILNRRPASEWIETLRQYANCFVDRIGDEVYLIPDKPRASNHTVTANDMIEDTVRVGHAGGRNVPSAVTVYGQAFDGDTITGDPADGPIQYTYGTPGGAGTITELQMPWYQSAHACGRKAFEVYQKARSDMTLEFIGFDDGLERTIGDVGTITNAQFGLSSELMTLIENEQVGRGRWRRKYVQYNAGNSSDTIFTGTSNITTLQNPYNPGTGPTPDIDWEYNSASPQEPILTLSWTGVSWAYIQDYYVRVYSSDSPEVVIFDSATDGYITHTGAGDTHTVDLSGTPVEFGSTYIADVYRRSNVGAVGTTPGTDSVEVVVPEIVVEGIYPNEDGVLSIVWAPSVGKFIYTYASDVGTAGDWWVSVATPPGVAFVSGDYVFKYEVESIVSGSAPIEINGSAGVEGTWYDLVRTGTTGSRIQLWQTAQPSPLAAEHAVILVTVAEDNGAGSPVAGTEEIFRATLIAYKGVNDYIVHDTLTDTNGTNLTAHSPNVQTVSPGGWIADAGTFTIQSGTAQTTGDARYVIDAGVANAAFKAAVRMNGNDIGVIGRRVDANNYWELRVADADSADPTLQLIEVNSSNSPNATVRASVAMTGGGPFNDGFTQSFIRLMFDGDDIYAAFIPEAAQNDRVVHELQYTSSTFNSATHFGIHGIHDSGTATFWFELYVSDIEIGLIT